MLKCDNVWIYINAAVWFKGLLFCSQFGDQFIADLCELLDLLILWETEREKQFLDVNVEAKTET